MSLIFYSYEIRFASKYKKRAKPLAVACVVYLFISGKMFPFVVLASRNAGDTTSESSRKYRKRTKDFDHTPIVVQGKIMELNQMNPPRGRTTEWKTLGHGLQSVDKTTRIRCFSRATLRLVRSISYKVGKFCPFRSTKKILNG